VINAGVASGVKKLKWNSKGTLESFVRESRRSCAELSSKIAMFKSNFQKIYDKCHDVSAKILIKIDTKKVYEIRQFEEEQEKHKKDLAGKLKSALEDIRKTLCETYEHFVFQRNDIQQVWFNYVRVIDAKIEEALKKAVKISLLMLYNVVGEEKNIPIFKLSVELENNQIVFKVYKLKLKFVLKIYSAWYNRTNQHGRPDNSLNDRNVQGFFEDGAPSPR
jgi:dynein heavy chain